MSKKWALRNLFRKDAEESLAWMNETLSQKMKDDYTPGEKTVPVANTNVVYLPEVKSATLQLWELWAHSYTPPLLKLEVAKNTQDRELALQRLQQESVYLIDRIEQDARNRLQQIEQEKESETFSLDSSCQVYVSRDRMQAWACFFPPYGPEGKFEASALGRALELEDVTTGIDDDEVARLVLKQTYFELIPIAEGTEPTAGSDGEIVELFSREISQDVIVDEDGMADYRALNYVRQIAENEHICDIVHPQKGVPGVQVDGKPVNPKPVKPAKVPRGMNTTISEDGLHLVAARDGHLEFSNGLFHVRPVLEIKGDVDYSTGNIEFDGDIHICGDVREGFEVRASGTVTIDGLVEGATVETGGDLVISRGVVGDYRALLRSKGCVRVKYLENCMLYAGRAVYADCIMTSQIFSDDMINVTSGRGSVIGGSMTAAHSIRARMVGAQSGHRTELTLGALPYVQTELQNIDEELTALRAEISRINRDLAFLELTEGSEGGKARMTKARMRKSMLAMKEKKLAGNQNNLSPISPDLSKCRFEADTVYPVTTLRIQKQLWMAREIRHRCRLIYDTTNEEIKEIY